MSEVFWVVYIISGLLIAGLTLLNPNLKGWKLFICLACSCVPILNTLNLYAGLIIAMLVRKGVIDQSKLNG